MFGKFLSINDNSVTLENNYKRVESSILGLHVVFELNEKKIVGEVVEVTENSIKINFLGEIINNQFFPGINSKPTSNFTTRIIYKNELPLLLGGQNEETIEDLVLGKSLIYPEFNISADLNNFFSNHFAIIGNTGSGKSSSCASIIQTLFYRKQNYPKSSNIVLFDVYGEYTNALTQINESGISKSKNLTTQLTFADSELVSIPPWLLEVDDWALLLGVDNVTQMPIIEKALKLVYLFANDEANVIDHKNAIIAKAILDILSSGRNSTQIRDQVIAVLTEFNTIDLNLSSSISQPGYVRTLKQCLNIDATGKINTIQLVVEFLEKFITKEITTKFEDSKFKFTLKDLYSAFEFALISEGILKSERIYDRSNMLKVRLEHIINSNQSKYFEYNEYVTREEFIKKLFTCPTGEKAGILLINFNYIDERFAKVLTKIYSKIFFDFAVNLEKRSEFPIQIILEEAHRYVQNDRDVDILGYNIFDRITKEGRKYGILLGLVTQRPSELSNTALSQCQNFLIFRMFHPEDIKIVSSVSYNISDYSVERLKTLTPGVGMCFGTAFKIPLLVKMKYPNPPTNSSNTNIKENWFKKEETTVINQ